MARTDARILIADDMKTVLSVEEGLLVSLGFKPVCAESGKQALKLLLDGDFDLALVDYYMPDMNGTDVVRLCREVPQIGTVFIAVTSDVTQIALSCVKEGFNDVLQKPVDKAELVRLLIKYIPVDFKRD